MSIEQSLNRLKELVRDRYPADALNTETNPREAEAKDLAALYSKFGDVDSELIELLGLRNGETTQLFPPFVLFDIATVISNFDDLVDLYQPVDDDPGWSDPDEYCDTAAGWHFGWIPIADSNTEPLFVDMSPGPKGKKGQIVCAHYNRELCVQSWSLQGWFDYVFSRIQNDTLPGSDYHILLRENPNS